MPMSWTRILVRRATPYAALASILAVQALARTDAVVAFPLYLAVVLVVSLQQDRAEAFAVAALAAVAVVIPPLATSRGTAEVASAILLAAVLLAVALAVGELMRHARASTIAAQRQADEMLAVDRRLHALLESAQVGLGLADLEGRLTMINDRLAAILSRGREELLGTTVAGLTAEGDRPGVEEGLGLIRSGDIGKWEAMVELVPADGKRVPVGLFLSRIPSTVTGEPAIVVQLTDMTQRRRADSIVECLSTVRQVLVNSAAVDIALPPILAALCSRLGWSAAQLWMPDADRSAMRVRTAWNASGPLLDGFLHACRGAAPRKGEALAGRVWKTGAVSAEEDVQGAAHHQLRAAARMAGLQSALAFPIVSAGEVIGVVELLSDSHRTVDDDEVSMLADAGLEIGQFIRRSETASALRRSEADHRAIFERSPIGIARIGGDGELLEANSALLHILEQDEETMRMSGWPDLLRAYDQAAGRQHRAPFLGAIGEASTLQVRAATGAGNWLWLQLTATSIPDATGAPEHILVMVEDVTAVRETSDRLNEALDAQRQANIDLAKLDRTKSEFLSIVSHEFRTALTGIQGFSELIRDGGLEGDEVKAYGGYIFNDAHRVNRLITDMLDLDRMESGRMSMRSGDVDINDVLMEAISRAAPSATSVEFKSDLDPRLPIVVGDRDRLIQVVSNIVNNAVKYSPDGGTVTISSRVEGRFALISVTDTGLGIPPDEIGHVFERFRRVRSGAAQSIPGTGLGLTIVKQIVEMHGGKIWVESAVGHGSSFHFTIPLAPESANALQLRHA
ncbi:MAG TPA: ATP-binding protein [Candidatus Dormibacteraeota bacterium]